MIRDVVVHLHNEQPLLADLYEEPKASDSSLVCTNLRTLNGKRPVFVDDQYSMFVFPLGFVRFVELPPRSVRQSEPVARPEAGEVPALPAPPAPPEEDIEIDEDFLRRIREA